MVDIITIFLKHVPVTTSTAALLEDLEALRRAA